MIFIEGHSFSTPSSSPSQPQGDDILLALLESPNLISATSSFKANPERKFLASDESGSERSKWVYIFQKEYATVDPALVDFVGTDEATTCVGLVIRNKKTGMTSVAHMDSPEIVEMGLSQMLSSLVANSLETEFEVHLIGGFEDVSLQQGNGSAISESPAYLDGYSFPLCSKIVHTLWSRDEKFHLQTFCVLGHNTRRDSDGNTYPFFNGFVVETASGIVIPAIFDRTSRCPDELVRRIRVSVSYEDANWKEKLLETYDCGSDCFKIAPCRWTLRQYHIALSLLNCSDSEILSTCSTSPTAEAPDFVDNLRRQWSYLMEHPHWTETFPMKQPRTFARSCDGRWIRC
ncbi:protein N-terminal asparagine amidohydrolase isoform X2 [Vigna radiata var. radiata]|uniref:Protein N-terminal asparagine amidohydrolase isoform X2 n=1 Tax=Vigna radiata var. radiata TaxID=3916 RepID=A0A1S3TYA2_VIGRR|nr:protein N-terminal asparagine amidohydrolase isoform X2 [Vigna radiata var. radiata]